MAFETEDAVFTNEVSDSLCFLDKQQLHLQCLTKVHKYVLSESVMNAMLMSGHSSTHGIMS